MREVVVLVATAAAVVLGGAFDTDGTLGAPDPVAYAVAALGGAVLPLRHRAPVPVLAATTLLGVLAVPLGLFLTPFVVAPVVVASYAVGLRLDRGPAATVLVPAGLLLVASAPFAGSALSWEDGSRLTTVVGAPLVAGVLGHATRNRRDYLAAVEERAARAEQSRESEARRRVEEERVRIARELHDVVAHQVTLAHAQAMVASRVFDSRPEQARSNLTDLVRTTSDALDDLRATVGLLRDPDDGAAPDDPAPGLARLPALVESFARAGLTVTVRQDGDVRPLPPGVDLTCYRIVQEALTNVAKHAGTDAAEVHLAWRRDRLAITVADQGRGGAGRPSNAPGYGLIGLRERAAAVGGVLSAGERPGGGFEVSTQLPIPPPTPGDGEQPR